MPISKNMLSLVLLVILSALVACQKNVAPTIACNAYNGFNMEQAVSNAQEDMINRCPNVTFEYLVRQLVLTGQRDPKPGNRDAIRDFCQWAGENQYAPKQSTIHEYKKYFGNGLRVNDGYSVNALLETKPAAVERDLRQSLEYQREGSRCTGDKQAYARAVERFNAMITLLDAAAMAHNKEL